MSDITKEPSSTLNWVPAKKWIQLQVDFGRALNTIDAYKRALDDYLSFCKHEAILPEAAKREDIARYVRDLSERPNPHGIAIRTLDSGVGLANATMQQRLTVVRWFYDYLMEEGLRQDNPVGRGRSHQAKDLEGRAKNSYVIGSCSHWLTMLVCAVRNCVPSPPVILILLIVSFIFVLSKQKIGVHGLFLTLRRQVSCMRPISNTDVS